MSRPPRKGSTRKGRTLRLAVLERDGWRCQIRGPHCTKVADHADHIVPYALGGADTLENLRAACRRCNLERGARLDVKGPHDGVRPLFGERLQWLEWADELVDELGQGDDDDDKGGQ